MLKCSNKMVNMVNIVPVHVNTSIYLSLTDLLALPKTLSFALLTVLLERTVSHYRVEVIPDYLSGK